MNTKTKILLPLIMVAITIFTILSLPSKNINAEGEQILMPFRYDEVWDTNVKNLRDDYGIHKDKIGVGIDFYTDRSSRVIAPVSGNVTIGCTANGVTSYVITRSNGMLVRLIHLLDNTISKRSGWINQGESVGMTAPRGDYNQNNCNVSSDGYHVHLSLATSNPNSCSFNIDSYIFNCAGMRSCERTLNNAYALSFKVECNRQYLNQSFISTNGFPLNNDQCNNLINQFRNNSIATNTENSLNLQVCLRKKGLYDQIYTRSYDQYSKDRVNQYYSDLSNKAKQEQEQRAQVEAEAKELERLRIENEKKIAEEKIKKDEEERQKAEAIKKQEDQKIQDQKQKKLDEERKIEEDKKIESRDTMLKNTYITLGALITGMAGFVAFRYTKKQ
jgi:hypothetical protein